MYFSSTFPSKNKETTHCCGHLCPVRLHIPISCCCFFAAIEIAESEKQIIVLCNWAVFFFAFDIESLACKCNRINSLGDRQSFDFAWQIHWNVRIAHTMYGSGTATAAKTPCKQYFQKKKKQDRKRQRERESKHPDERTRVECFLFVKCRNRDSTLLFWGGQQNRQ